MVSIEYVCNITTEWQEFWLRKKTWVGYLYKIKIRIWIHLIKHLEICNGNEQWEPDNFWGHLHRLNLPRLFPHTQRWLVCPSQSSCSSVRIIWHLIQEIFCLSPILCYTLLPWVGNTFFFLLSFVVENCWKRKQIFVKPEVKKK